MNYKQQMPYRFSHPVNIAFLIMVPAIAILYLAALEILIAPISPEYLIIGVASTFLSVLTINEYAARKNLAWDPRKKRVARTDWIFNHFRWHGLDRMGCRKFRCCFNFSHDSFGTDLYTGYAYRRSAGIYWRRSNLLQYHRPLLPET